MTSAGSLLKKQELIPLAMMALLAMMHVLLWSQIKENPLLSVALLTAALLAGAGLWAWKNFKMVKTDPQAHKRISVKIESILHSLFLPRGYDIMTLPEIDDERLVGSAELRDVRGIPVLVQYHEWPLEQQVDIEDMEELDGIMGGREIPKGICLATTHFTPAAQEYARKKNILLKNTDELVEMIRQAEQEIHSQATGEVMRCITCGSKLNESDEVTDLMVCGNPDCGKTYTPDELEQEQKKEAGNITSITISCYECNRPVQLDTEMKGLVECPYDDCSWIINVDNELLALKGGLDKRSSENLAEIDCPRCEKTIKVPADADGLMECPCEEKWIIDVGQALGQRAQAQLAEGLQTDLQDSENQDENSDGQLIDCPGCGAGVPKTLENCPVCGAALPHEAGPDVTAADDRSESQDGEQPPLSVGIDELNSASPSARAMTHRHAYLSLGTGGLVLLIIFSVSAFLAFVYLVAR
jgi:hypothetical protein